MESSPLRREVFENNLNEVENNSRVTGVLFSVLVVLAWSRPGLAEVSQELSPAQSVSERVPDREFPAPFMTHSPAPPSHITG